MAHLWCRSLVQGRPHMDVGLTRRAGLVVVRCGGCRWSGQRHYKKHCRSLREASITLKKLLIVHGVSLCDMGEAVGRQHGGGPL